MVECDYCERSFDDTDSYLAHLDADHEGELGRIDRRRVADFRGGDTERDTGTYVLGGLALLAVGALGLILVWSFTGGLPFLGGGAVDAVREPTSQPGAIHEHGTMNATIAGQELDFSRERFRLQADCFHFEPGYRDYVWHTHCTGVTLQWALGTLGIETNPEGTVVTFDGETYRESEGWDVTMTVDGEPVEPGSYVLEGIQGTSNLEAADNVRLVVEEA